MERDLLLGGVASWAGIKISSAAYSHLGEWINHHKDDVGNEMHSIIFQPNSSRTPLIAHDVNGTMLVSVSDIFYVRVPHLDIFQMDKTENGVILTKRDTEMYRSAVSHPNDSSRIKTQSDIWLLHMLLSDLRTLVTHCKARVSKEIAEPFMFVVSNITREKMPQLGDGKTGFSWAWETGLGLFINNNTARESRKSASELLDHLHKKNAPRLLASQLNEASLSDHVFLSIPPRRNGSLFGCILSGDGDVWGTVRVHSEASEDDHSKRVGRIRYSIIDE
jgi:hypothetical protein